MEDGDALRPEDELMAEHRIIEKVLGTIYSEIGKSEVDNQFIIRCADFFYHFADAIHHKKEEKVIFERLYEMDVDEEKKKVLATLVKDHARSIELAKKLVDASDFYQENKSGLKDVIKLMEELVELYSSHMEIEENEMFTYAFSFFTDDERVGISREFNAFDPTGSIHEKYSALAEELVQEKGLGEIRHR